MLKSKLFWQVVLSVILTTTFFLHAQTVSMSFNKQIDTVITKSTGKCQILNYSSGNHQENDCLSWSQKKDDLVWKAEINLLNGEVGSGKIGDHFVLDAGNCPTPENLNESFDLEMEIPADYVLYCKGKLYDKPKAKISFLSHFESREFPRFLLKKDKFKTYQTPFNQDSVLAIYAWTDSTDLKALPEIKAATERAIFNISKLAPKFWKKYIQNFGGVQYSIVVFIHKDIYWGLEKMNSPYIVISNKYIYLTESIAYHELNHSLNGRSIIGQGYVEPDGKFHQSGLLSFNEGLVTFMAMRYIPAEYMTAHLSALIYRAKLDYGCDDITILPYCSEFKTYYAKGYCFDMVLVAAGFNPDKFYNWLFDDWLLNKKWPIVANSDDVFKWLNLFDKKIGALAKKIYTKEYLSLAFSLLEQNSWKPIPLYKTPSWDSLYVGPYPIKNRYPVLPHDKYLKTNVLAKYLILPDEKLELKPNNKAMELIKNNPDKESLIELSDGSIEKVPNRLCFLDGTPYFMFGETNLTDKNISFYKKINFYIK